MTLRKWFEDYILPNEDLTVADYDGYDGLDFKTEVRQMSDAISGQLSDPLSDGNIPEAPVGDIGSMNLCPVCDDDGIIEGFSMEISFPLYTFSQVCYLSTYLSWKSLTTDREAKSTDAAWAVVESLVSHWITLRSNYDKIIAALGNE